MMAAPKIDKGLIVSATAHLAVLLWAGLSLAAKPMSVPPTEALFVETMSFSEFSEMTAGAKTAPKKEAPKPLVEKKAEPKPVETPEAKISEKPEIVASAAQSAPPPEEAKLPDPKPVPRAAHEPRKEPVKEPPEAEALHKKDKPEKEVAKKSEPKPMPPRRPQHKPKVAKAEPKPETEQPKFDADRIAALLDRREPRRLAAAGETLSNTPALGTSTGRAASLSQNEIDALRARIQQCWNPPAGVAEARDLIVQVRILFRPDGSLAAEPRLINQGGSGYQQIAAESALRAIRRCAPYSFMPAAKYEAWKDVEVTFDPRDLFRG